MNNVCSDEELVFSDKHHDLKVDEMALINMTVCESTVVKLATDHDYEFANKVHYCWISNLS